MLIVLRVCMLDLDPIDDLNHQVDSFRMIDHEFTLCRHVTNLIFMELVRIGLLMHMVQALPSLPYLHHQDPLKDGTSKTLMMSMWWVGVSLLRKSMTVRQSLIRLQAMMYQILLYSMNGRPMMGGICRLSQRTPGNIWWRRRKLPRRVLKHIFV